MNEQSIAYINNISKQQLSRIDNPFDLNWEPKGATNISHERNLSEYADELTYTYGKFDGEQYTLNLSSLSEYQQGELARLYIEYTDRETSECVYGNDFSINSDFTCALLAMLAHDSLENREAFCIERHATKHYYVLFR